MSIAIDAVSTHDSGGNTNNYNASHTCGASADLLVVSIWLRQNNTSGDQLTGVTYNSVSLTEAVSNTTSRGAYIYYLANPATGTNTLNITSSQTDDVRVVIASYTGADTTTPLDATTTGSDSATTYTLSLTVGEDDVALQGAFAESTAWSSDGANTTTYSGGGVNTNRVGAVTDTNVNTGSNSLVYTNVGSGQVYYAIASFKSASAGSNIKSIGGLTKANIKSMAGITF